jgi:23S rRNA (adenine2503-C2)-methyltransferase
MKSNLTNMTIKEMEIFFDSIGEKKFRAKQTFAWIHKGARNFEEMTDLSKELRDKLSEFAFVENLIIENMQLSSKDGTRKYLLRLSDGYLIETVFMKYRYGNSICISSQAGCRMGCRFCASAIGGLERNLTAAEMLSQITAVGSDTGERIGHVVVMGTGEPFDNYENLIKFIELAHTKEGLNLGLRNITVSTCGIIPKIQEFAHDAPQVNLAISLHAANDKLRSSLMPINPKYPVKDLVDAARAHANRTKRQVTFEYALIGGINDSEKHAKELAGLLRGLLCHVNLIPLNTVSETGLTGSGRQRADEFKTILEAANLETTIRREMGEDISAACGQLRLGR